MARATRSSTQQESVKPLDSVPQTRKTASKKRKRASLADGTEQPAPKQARVDGKIKEESSQEPEEHPVPNTIATDLPSSGDVPLQPADAEKILDILEMVDTQGLLDRVFPLPAQSEEANTPSSIAGPSTSPHSHSLRSLLKEPGHYPLRVLQAAVQHLFPISSHPRSRPSAPAAEQLRFCNLVISLLDQASSHAIPVPLNVVSLIPSSKAEESEASGSGKPVLKARDSHMSRRKYALVQRLPTGDWWTSTNSSIPSDGKELADLPTSHADLVAIFPSPSSIESSGNVLTLAECVRSTPKTSQYYPHEPRRVSCGKFLDYGPFSTFAPSFDQEGAEIGRVALGEVIWHHERKRRLRERLNEKLPITISSPGDTSSLSQSVGSEQRDSTSQGKNIPESLNGLLSPDQIRSLKSALGSLELEQAVQELLERNAKALQRLEELQLLRLGGEGGDSSIVEVGSEEWDVAQGILDSLTILASLRPRSSLGDSEHPPIVPTVSALRKLHRTLPVESTGGWFGTLPAGRTTALRDDTTIHVKSGAASTTVAAPVAPIAAPPATPATKTPAPTAPYNYNAYQGYGTAQYRGGYGTFTPAQSGSYYQNYPATQQTPTPTHYPNSQYNTAGQHQFAYNSWYNYQPPGSSQAGAASGRATPQPATPAGFLPSGPQPQPQRAVANTVLSTAAPKGYQGSAWTNGSTSGAGFVAPTLPPHLRTSGGGGNTPGTPQPASAGNSFTGLYGSYPTPTQSSAR